MTFTKTQLRNIALNLEAFEKLDDAITGEENYEAVYPKSPIALNNTEAEVIGWAECVDAGIWTFTTKEHHS